MNTLIPLTSSVKIEPSSHVLYFYNTIEGYIKNACSYIQTGINLGQHIVFIDSKERYQMVLDHLGPVNLDYVHYVNNYDFYEMYHDFQFKRVISNLKDIVEPYVEGQLNVRIWGHVDWKDQEDMLNKLHSYECNCDVTVSGLGFTTVCAYNGQTVPANIFLEMLKTHEYAMTDDKIFRSSLYKGSDYYKSTDFPSLSMQATLDTEMDLYKQKLDFVHVVSHEVRNPLTVIKAYATILQAQEQDEERRLKLEAINNYAVVIDNEISHIINTEQMLSTDALWQKKLIRIESALSEVITIMRIKALTQNITLKAEIELTGKEILFSNLMGFKMIVSNLLSNAIKYSYEGKQVFLNVKREGSFILINVKDEGIGMTEDQLNKLYLKYEKLNQEQSGQGIGLFMVKKLVDHFKGIISVMSKQGEGTTFQVKVPIHS